MVTQFLVQYKLTDNVISKKRLTDNIFWLILYSTHACMEPHFPANSWVFFSHCSEQMTGGDQYNVQNKCVRDCVS